MTPANALVYRLLEADEDDDGLVDAKRMAMDSAPDRDTQFTSRTGTVWHVRVRSDPRYTDLGQGPSVSFGKASADGAEVHYWPAYTAVTILEFTNHVGNERINRRGEPMPTGIGINMNGSDPDSYLPPDIVNQTKLWLVSYMPYLLELVRERDQVRARGQSVF